MNHTIQDILDFIDEHDVKFIRLAFCDVFGHQKNISVRPKHIADIFEKGLLIDGHHIPGLTTDQDREIWLYPDPSSFDILPWRPQSGSVIRVFCKVCYSDGSVQETDCRTLLKEQLDMIRQKGYQLKNQMGSMFSLLKEDQESCPYDDAGYLDVAPMDKGEDIRRQICLNLEEMGIDTESSYHEQGPGQNAIDLEYHDILTSCDQMMTLRWAIQTIADLYDLKTSFLSQPLINQNPNQLHMSYQVMFQNQNMLLSFIAGILTYMQDMTLFMRWNDCSYHQNIKYHESLMRTQKTKHSCQIYGIESACNPYLVNYLFVMAGMEGIEKNLTFTQNDFKQSLPSTLEEAIECAKSSDFIHRVLPLSLLRYYVERKPQSQ